MTINMISFVGVDERTDLNLLNILARKSLVNLEFGILYSESRNGKEKRYPGLQFQRKFAELQDCEFSKSLHICGQLASDVIVSDPLAQYNDVYRELRYWFNAIQINFKLEDTHNISDLISNLKIMVYDGGVKDFIIQSNKSKAKLVNCMLTEIYEPQNIRLLYDGSGGFGKVISEIQPPYEDFYTGYAGGINPDNILEIATKIDNLTGGVNVYIDMESGVRENDILSLKKCLAVIDAVNKIKENKLLEY